MRPSLFLLVWFLGEPRCVQKRKVILPLLLGQEPAPNCRESNSLHWSNHLFSCNPENLHNKTCSHRWPCTASKIKVKGRLKALRPCPAFHCNIPLAGSLPQSTLIHYLDKMPCEYWGSLFTTFFVWLTHFSNLKSVITGNSLAVGASAAGGTSSIPG